MNKMILTAAVAAVVAGGGAFYAGMQYAKAQAPSRGAGQFQQFGGGQGGRRNGSPSAGGFVGGEILSKDDKSITVKMRDGSTKIVFFSSSTSIGKVAEGTAADLAVGKQVTVMGMANSDGSVTAQSIQLRPAMPMPQASSAPTTTQAGVKQFTVVAQNFAFAPGEIRVKKGDTVKLTLQNQDGFHDLVIDEFNVRTPRIGQGQTADVQFVADKTGTFQYYCSVANHRAMGMWGNLVVE